MTGTETELVDFARLVMEMRKAQRAWFSGHQRDSLIIAKQLERQVDEEVERIVNRQGRLWAGDAS